MEFNLNTITNLLSIACSLMVLYVVVQAMTKIVSVLDRISETQEHIADTQKETARGMQGILTRVAVMDARQGGNNNPNE